MVVLLVVTVVFGVGVVVYDAAGAVAGPTPIPNSFSIADNKFPMNYEACI